LTGYNLFPDEGETGLAQEAVRKGIDIYKKYAPKQIQDKVNEMKPQTWLGKMSNRICGALGGLGFEW
jgi:hypothetical protein